MAARFGVDNPIRRDAGIPVCVACAGEIGKVRSRGPGGDTHTILVQQLSEAAARAESASQKFNVIMSDVPTGIPHPDGIQRLHNASRQMSNARDELMKTHHRLNEYIASGVVPDDLKGGGKQ